MGLAEKWVDIRSP